MPELNMFEDITSANIASYWNTLQQAEAPYLGEILFPNTQIPTNTVSFYRGLSRAPKPLSLSALDAKAIQRDRQGFKEFTVKAGFFKEAKYIDEQLREQLVKVKNSPITSQKDIILGRIFNDSAELLRGAALSREIMRMQLLQTGKFSIAGNGQVFAEDYQMKASHVADAKAIWGTDGASPVDDIRRAMDTIGTEEGITLTRVLMNQKTFHALLTDNEIKSTLLANNANTAAVSIPRQVLLAFLKDEFGIIPEVYDKGYVDATGAFVRFIPDGNVVFLPAENLGTTAFAPTPEETDLLASSAADVTITDTGVAVTTTLKDDPVTKQTKVTQKVVPTFEMIDGVYVLHAFTASAGGNTTTPGGGTEGDGSEAGGEDGKQTPPEG